MSSPSHLAQEIALLIDGDPIMARQVKEHIEPDRLAECLELARPACEAETVDDALEGFESDKVLEYIAQKYKCADVLKAFRAAKA